MCYLNVKYITEVVIKIAVLPECKVYITKVDLDRCMCYLNVKYILLK